MDAVDSWSRGVVLTIGSGGKKVWHAEAVAVGTLIHY